MCEISFFRIKRGQRVADKWTETEHSGVRRRISKSEYSLQRSKDHGIELNAGKKQVRFFIRYPCPDFVETIFVQTIFQNCNHGNLQSNSSLLFFCLFVLLQPINTKLLCINASKHCRNTVWMWILDAD